MSSEDGLFKDLSEQAAPQPAGRGAPRLRHPERHQVGFELAALDDLVPDDHPVRAVWQFVETMLDLSEQQLRREIERGRIKWAFNLGVGQRNHVQILVRALAHYGVRTIILPATVEGVAAMVLPPESATSGTVRGTELQFALNIRSQHVAKLIEAGLVDEASESQAGRGRFGSPIITRASVARLLARRRMK